MRKHPVIIVAAAAIAAIAATVALTTNTPPTVAELVDTTLAFVRATPGTVLSWLTGLWDALADVARSVVHVYDAPGNAGVQLAGIGGYEWRGTPGLFLCDGQC